MIDIDRAIDLKIRMLKHLNKKEYFASAISQDYQKTTIKELYKERGIRYQDISSRQFERIINRMVGEDLIKTFNIKKYLYYKITETGKKVLKIETKELKSTQKETNGYIDELLEGLEKV